MAWSKGRKSETTPMTMEEKTEKVAAQLIAAMNEGRIPWRKPWTGIVPQSVSGHKYRNGNLFVLAMAEYVDHRWITYGKAVQLGGNVKKGEKGTKILKPSPVYKRDGGSFVFDANGKKVVAYMAYGIDTVFNVEQTENCDLPALSEVVKDRHNDAIVPELEAFFESLPWTLEEVETADRAFFRTSEPCKVYMPLVGRFKSRAHYYATKLHELVHATGTKCRLDRPDHEKRGDEVYSFEELIAEMGAAMLCAHFGIDNTELTVNAVAYLQSWGAFFKNDASILMKAASAAQKAVTFLMQDYLKQEEEMSADTVDVPDLDAIPA